MKSTPGAQILPFDLRCFPIMMHFKIGTVLAVSLVKRTFNFSCEYNFSHLGTIYFEYDIKEKKKNVHAPVRA